MDTSPFEALVAEFGTQAEMLRRINAELPEDQALSPQAISKWKAQIPADRVLLLERLSGVSRHKQRPDVFGPPAEEAELPGAV